MSYVTREAVKVAIGLVLVGTWLVITVGLVLGAQAMTIDEEWQGWDLGLGLMFVIPYLMFSAGIVGAIWKVCRLQRLN